MNDTRENLRSRASLSPAQDVFQHFLVLSRSRPKHGAKKMASRIDTRKGNEARAHRIFVLADTHDRLPANVVSLAADADEIWHLGDVCAEIIADELRAAGPPVTVVRGNCDMHDEWPLVVDHQRGGLTFRLQHIPPERAPEDVDVVLHGHTHVPRNERLNGVLFLNPGCVTRPNRGAAASAAWLEIDRGKINWRLIPLR